MYEPLDDAESASISQKASQTEAVIDIAAYIRLGFMEPGSVKMQLAPSSVMTVKERLDHCPRFHATMKYRWIYKGYLPATLNPLGLMTFGDVDLNPTTGIFEGGTLSPRRMTTIIQEMKLMCLGLPILNASLESQPSHKVKPDKDTLAKNEELLRRDLMTESSVSAGVNKKGFESTLVYCGYCSATETDDGVKLFRCACKHAYYCSKNHQKAHWRDHKPECEEIRNKKAATKSK